MPSGVLADDVTLKLPVLPQSAPALNEPLGAPARDLLGLRGALGVQRLLGLAQDLAAIPARAQPLGQLVAARLAIELVLGSVDARRVLEDLLGDLLIAARRVMRCGRGDLGAVDRDNTDLDQTTARAERQHLAEQIGDRRLVTDPEARRRRVIRRLVGSDHTKRDIVVAAALDRPRRAHPDRIGVDEQRNHHRRVVRRSTPTVVAITRMKRRQIQLRRPRPKQTMRGAPQAATPAGSAATTAPAHDHTR